ncbi:MAG: hypothetical protein KDD62_06750 [Bdellovibrionales bacterium]|nr:hypothetical protein [Bdellovibrionales bacterium]
MDFDFDAIEDLGRQNTHTTADSAFQNEPNAFSALGINSHIIDYLRDETALAHVVSSLHHQLVHFTHPDLSHADTRDDFQAITQAYANLSKDTSNFAAAKTELIESEKPLRALWPELDAHERILETHHTAQEFLAAFTLMTSNISAGLLPEFVGSTVTLFNTASAATRLVGNMSDAEFYKLEREAYDNKRTGKSVNIEYGELGSLRKRHGKQVSLTIENNALVVEQAQQPSRLFLGCLEDANVASLFGQYRKPAAYVIPFDKFVSVLNGMSLNIPNGIIAPYQDSYLVSLSTEEASPRVFIEGQIEKVQKTTRKRSS